jgi:hypothetical protein
MTYKELQFALTQFRTGGAPIVALDSTIEILQSEYDRLKSKQLKNVNTLLEAYCQNELSKIDMDCKAEVINYLEKYAKIRPALISSTAITYQELYKELLIILELIEAEQKIVDSEIIEYFKGDEHILPDAIPALLGHKTRLRLDFARLNVQSRLDWILEDIAYKKDEIYASFYDKEISLLNYCLSK